MVCDQLSFLVFSSRWWMDSHVWSLMLESLFLCWCMDDMAWHGRYSSPLLFTNDEVHGGSPYGAGTLTNGDGSRMPSDLEKSVRQIETRALRIKLLKVTTIPNDNSFTQYPDVLLFRHYDSSVIRACWYDLCSWEIEPRLVETIGNFAW